jgi:hypothetical protein
MKPEDITPGQWDLLAQMLRQGDLAWEVGHVDQHALELEAMGILQGHDAGDEIDFTFTPKGMDFAEDNIPMEYL